MTPASLATTSRTGRGCRSQQETLSDFVELPVSWELDDAPYFLRNFFPYMSGFVDTSPVLEIWKAEFDGSYQTGGCFFLVLHPFCIGRHPRIPMPRPADRVHQELPRRVVWHPPRGRRGMAPEPSPAGFVGHAGHRSEELTGRKLIDATRERRCQRLPTIPMCSAIELARAAPRITVDKGASDVLLVPSLSLMGRFRITSKAAAHQRRERIPH